MFDATIRRLHRVMDKERSCLLAGDLEGAAALIPTKSRLLERLRPDDTPAAQIEALKQMARRNDALIAAAREGIEAARARLRDIQNGSAVSTYSAMGHRETIRPPQETVRKRA